MEIKPATAVLDHRDSYHSSDWNPPTFRERRSSNMSRFTFSPGVRVIALFEAAKAVLVLLAGFGCLSLLHRDVHDLAVRAIKHSHLNPAHHYPRIFIDAASRVTDTHLWVLAGLALAYAIIRGAEAVGLWYERRWAEWLALCSGLIYLPIEIYEISHGVNWIKVGAILVNVVIVLYMAQKLRRKHVENDVKP